MLTDKDDKKIFVLYILNSIGYPLEYGVLHDMCVQDGFITSFDFLESFDELLSAGNVEMEERDEQSKNMISITEKGKHIAVTLNGRLLSSVKERAMKSALRLLSFKKQGTRMLSSGRELSRGKYEMCCEIANNDGEIMSLKIIYDTQKQLDRALYNFDSHPEFIYKGILALLSGEVDYLMD
ncbi:MAG: DUF4364 family protein [Clostridia bacterium]|nr:DUF4364 family protein [Oscillospiraceae bacterium]MBQ6701325.1 DUF4364 family protein [Clostridia bacterium]